MSLDWKYSKRHVDVSMLRYGESALACFNVNVTTRPQHSLQAYIQPNYGVAIQFTDPSNNLKPLSNDGIRKVKETIGTLVYYTCAINSAILVALGELGQQQIKLTQNIAKSIEQLHTYVATHPDATVWYHIYGMTLHVNSNASYLSCSNARSRIGGYFVLSSALTTSDDPT